MKASILSTIIKEQREDWLSQERTKQSITRKLYWKFDTDRQKQAGRECKWKTWLVEHIAKFKKDLEEFRRTEHDRMQRLQTIQSKRKTVAGLTEVQSKLKKEVNTLDSFHQIELQKAINALRRTALIKGVAEGKVITKEDFDRHISGILAPTVSGPLQESAFSQMFHEELKVAVDKVVELEKVRTDESRRKYDDWLMQKDRLREEAIKKKVKYSLKITRNKHTVHTVSSYIC